MTIPEGCLQLLVKMEGDPVQGKSGFLCVDALEVRLHIFKRHANQVGLLHGLLSVSVKEVA